MNKKNYQTYKPYNMRFANTKQIIKLVRDSKHYLSRAEIGRKINLSPPVVSEIVNILLEKNIIIETKKQKKNNKNKVGRKPILLKMNPNCCFIIGILINKNKITLALVNSLGNVKVEKEIDYELCSSEECIPLLKNVITNLMEENKISNKKLLGINIALPGAVDKSSGKIKLAPTIKQWEDTVIDKKLENYFNCKINIENSVNAAVMGEKWKGKFKKDINAVFIKIGQSIGSGILINGDLYKGNENLAGEVGFITTKREHIIKNKEDVGPFEKNYGIDAIIKECKNIINLNNVSTNEEKLDIILKYSKKGNKDIETILKDSCDHIAILIANVINILNPSKVAIGGEYIKIAEYYLSDIKETVSNIVPSRPEIIISELGEKVFYLGAIAGQMKNIEDDILINLVNE